MDKAKAAVSNFVSRSGKHDTTVHEQITPAVTEEHVIPQRHEEVQQAVDREVHQDHYHTTIQPIQHQEVLPEKHLHQMAAVQERSFDHENPEQTRAKLEREAARFKDTSTTHETRVSSATAPTIEGEHIHHHVHETVQPVIHKETITPEVVHTTVPIHEVHHASAHVHGASVLPPKTLKEFTSAGGILDGQGKESHEAYEGCPRPYNKEMQLGTTEADKDYHAGLHVDHNHEHTQGHKHGLNQGTSTAATGTSGLSDIIPAHNVTTSGNETQPPIENVEPSSQQSLPQKAEPPAEKPPTEETEMSKFTAEPTGQRSIGSANYSGTHLRKDRQNTGTIGESGMDDFGLYEHSSGDVLR